MQAHRWPLAVLTREMQSRPDWVNTARQIDPSAARPRASGHASARARPRQHLRSRWSVTVRRSTILPLQACKFPLSARLQSVDSHACPPDCASSSQAGHAAWPGVRLAIAAPPKHTCPRENRGRSRSLSRPPPSPIIAGESITWRRLVPWWHAKEAQRSVRGIQHRVSHGRSVAELLLQCEIR